MNTILKNKNCLVTGATGGIGKHIVKLLLKNQCNVFLTSKNNTNLKNFCESLALKNSKISCFAADLANTSQIDLLINKVKSNFSSIDILINCAGVFQIKPIEKCDNKEFDELLNVNLKATFLL